MASRSTLVRQSLFHNSGTGSVNVHSGNGNLFAASGQSNQTINYNCDHSSAPDSRNDSEKVRDTLAYPGIIQRRREVEEPAEQTCNWVFEHEAYKRWRESIESSLLWIRGHAGSGKSTLLKHLLETTTKSLGESQEAIILSYFFHGRGDELQKSWIGLLRSFCHQLLKQNPSAMPELPREMRANNQSGGQENWQWTENELSKALLRGLQAASATACVWIFVDALDEGGADNAYGTVQYFKSLVDKAFRTSAVRICFSCRYYLPDEETPDLSTIRMEEGNKDDISIATKRTLTENDMPNAELLGQYIADNASGIFLWAALVVKRLIRQRRSLPWEEMDKVKDQILRLETLKDIYKDIIDRIKEQSSEHRAESLGIFRWVCLSKYVLSPNVFWQAVTADVRYSKFKCVKTKAVQRAGTPPLEIKHEEIPERIRQRTFGLVEINKDSAQCIHQSVKDHLLQEGLASLQERSVVGPSEESRVLGASNYRMARICLEELSDGYEPHMLSSTSKPKSRVSPMCEHSSFHDYCKAAWVEHAETSEGLGCAEVDFLSYLESISDGFLAYLLPQDYVGEWPDDDDDDYDFLSPSRRSARSWKRPYRKLYQYLFQRRSPRPWQRPLSAKPIHLVFRYGLRQSLNAVEQRMLDQGYTRPILTLRLPHNTRDSLGNTPLMLATWGGHSDAVQLLLSHPSTDLNSQDFLGDTALILASRSGSVTITERLVREKSIDVNVRNELGETALLNAAHTGMMTVVAGLLGRKGIRIDGRNSDSESPLYVALLRGHDETAMLLLNAGAKMRSGYRRLNTLLLAACEGGCRAAARYLVQTSCEDVNIRDSLEEHTPLTVAMANRHWHIAQDLLLTGRVNQHSKNVAQFWAYKVSNLEMIQLLWFHDARLHESIYFVVGQGHRIGYHYLHAMMEATKGRSDEKEYKDVLLSAYAHVSGKKVFGNVLLSFEDEMRELLQGGSDPNYTFGNLDLAGITLGPPPDNKFIDSMVNLAVDDDFLKDILRKYWTQAGTEV